jgi:enoyl-CoA hydratase/carnithine racemase
MLTGDIVDAAEAHRIGLGNKVFPAAELDAAAWTYAARIAAGPPLVHRAIKRSVALSLSSSFDDALDRERENQMVLLQSKDFVEGVMAFLQKRDPSFSGS